MSERRALPPARFTALPGAFAVFAVVTCAALGVLGLLVGAAPARADDPPAAAPPAVAAPATATAPTGSPAAAAPGTPAAAPAPGVAAPTTPAEPVKRSKIAVEPMVQDAGKVRKGKKVAFDFQIANQGDGDLLIKDAQPSCGCTVASFDKKIVPGATGKLHATVATDNFDGPIAKHVTVLSNDPDTPRLVLTIKADVQAFLRVAPTYARILQVQTQPAETTAINLWATDGKAVEIVSIDTPFDWVLATVRRPTDAERTPDVPADQWRIEVSLAPDAPVGPLRDSLRVRTNHPEEPEIEIPLSGNVRRVLHFQPEEADFGKLVRPSKTAQEATRFVLKLFNFGKEPVEVRSIATDLPFVTASIKAEDPGRRYRVELLLAADAPKGKFAGHLRAETSSPVMPTLEIPVKGKVD